MTWIILTIFVALCGLAGLAMLASSVESLREYLK
jgi:hypothetical protein